MGPGRDGGRKKEIKGSGEEREASGETHERIAVDLERPLRIRRLRYLVVV